MPELSEEQAALFDQGQTDSMKGVMHDLGLTDKQANGVLDAYFKGQLEAHGAASTQAQEVQDAGMRDLQVKMGDNFDTMLDTGRAAVRKLSDMTGLDVTEMLNNTGTATNPVMMQIMAKVGETFLESGPKGNPSGGHVRW